MKAAKTYKGKTYTINDVPAYILKRYKDPHSCQEKVIAYWKKKNERNMQCYLNNKAHYDEWKREWNKKTGYAKKLWEKEKARMGADPEFRECRLKQQSEYWHSNKETIKIRRKTHNKSIQVTLRDRLKANLQQALYKHSVTGKIWASSKYGISYKKIINKLKADAGKLGKSLQDMEGKKYHIDHIIPASHFDLNNKDEIKKCYNPLNLRWLPAHENISRGNRIRPQDLEIIKTLPGNIYPKGKSLKQLVVTSGSQNRNA